MWIGVEIMIPCVTIVLQLPLFNMQFLITLIICQTVTNSHSFYLVISQLATTFYNKEWILIYR